MKIYYFPYIATGLGLLLLLLVIKGSGADAAGHTAVPLLTLLVVNEFAFFVTAIAAYIGIKHIRVGGTPIIYKVSTVACIVMAAGFLAMGIKLWPL